MIKYNNHDAVLIVSHNQFESLILVSFICNAHSCYNCYSLFLSSFDITMPGLEFEIPNPIAVQLYRNAHYGNHIIKLMTYV